MKVMIWQKHFLKEWLKTLLFFLSCFCFLYILIDYSSHSSSFHHQGAHFKWHELLSYYFYEIVRRFDLLLPFAALIATLRTLSVLNAQNEFVALLCSGISIRTLLSPFLAAALAMTLLLYANAQFLQPYALKSLKIVDETKRAAKNKAQKIRYVESMTLSDGSTLLYQYFDDKEERFFDLFWLSSTQEIWHIKYLYPYEQPPRGEHVDRLQRNENGQIIPVVYFATKAFDDLVIDGKHLSDSVAHPTTMSLMELWHKLPQHDTLSEKEAALTTTFYYKMAIPWLCLLAVVGAAPSCVRFSRHQHFFLVYATTIFLLVAFYLLMDAALVLGNRQVVDPAAAILLPFVAVVAAIIIRYLWKTR